MTARTFLVALVLAGFAAAVAVPAGAEDRGHGGGHGHGGRGDHDGGHHASPGWRDHDIRRFHEHDIEHWRGGRWYHGRHGGHDGWWWIVGGLWYFYPRPIYPYPSPYQPPIVVTPLPPAPPAYYYYCDDPPGYYPYVPTCRVPWRTVPAQ